VVVSGTSGDPLSWVLGAMAFQDLNYFYVISFSSIVVLLVISALVSASEVAFFSLTANDLAECRESDAPAHKKITDLIKKPRLLLATILVIHDFVNVGVVTLSTFLMWEMAGTRRPPEVIVGVVTFGATFFITFFAEIIPKVYAVQRNMTIAKRVTGLWDFLEKVCFPISWPLMRLTSLVERRVEKRGYSTTLEELNQALDLTTENNETTEKEKDILKGIVNFGTLTVKQVMKSRVDISAVDVELSFRDLMEQVKKLGFSRIPVYRESLDNIEGILYIKDLLPYMDEAAFSWQKLLRPGFFVPESKKLDPLLKDFQSKHVHMAVVVDEYGGTSGVITLEDLIEEIIGEINDEFDEVAVGYQKMDNKTFVFEGKTSLHDLCKVLEVEPSAFDDVRGESESLGGLMLELHGAMPAVDEKISFGRFLFTILSVDQKRIKKVRIVVNEELTA
jgi:putative hemolysin